MIFKLKRTVNFVLNIARDFVIISSNSFDAALIMHKLFAFFIYGIE